MVCLSLSFFPQGFWGNHSGLPRILQTAGDLARWTERSHWKAVDRRIKIPNFILHRSHGKHFSGRMVGCLSSHDYLHQHSPCEAPSIFRNPFLPASHFPGSNVSLWERPRTDEVLKSIWPKPIRHYLSSFVGYSAVTNSPKSKGFTAIIRVHSQCAFSSRSSSFPDRGHGCAHGRGERTMPQWLSGPGLDVASSSPVSSCSRACNQPSLWSLR